MATPIKPDLSKTATPDELKELSDWWERHGNLASTVLLVLAVAIVGARLWKAHAASRAEQAAAAFASASSLEDLEAATRDYASTPEAPAALLRAAARLCRQGDYQAARERYTDFLRHHASHALAPVARLGVAFTDEANGDYAPALATYEKHIAEAGSDDYLVPVATLGKARCLALLGNVDEARTVIDQFTADKSGTEWAIHADDLKAALPRMTFQKPVAPADQFEALLADLPDKSAKEDKPEAAPAAEAAPAEAAAPAPSPAPAAEAAPAADGADSSAPAGAPAPAP